MFRDSCRCFAKNDVNLLLFCVHSCFIFAMFPVYVCKYTQHFAKPRNISCRIFALRTLNSVSYNKVIDYERFRH